MPAIIKLDPSVPGIAVLLPFLAERVRVHARENEPRTTPDNFTAIIMSRIWARDPTILALGLVDPETSMLVGHVLAELTQSVDPISGEKIVTATTVQKRADGNVGDSLYEALDHVGVWAASQGASLLALHTKRDSREYEKRLGYKHGFHVLYKALGTNGSPG